MERVIQWIPPGSRVLEFGAGTGEQSCFLAERGFDVVAVDLESSAYSGDRVFPILDYDGRKIPLSDCSIDVIFSSNVLEHVEDLQTIFTEFKRILKPTGFGIHVMPTPAWRLWTTIVGYPIGFLTLFRTAFEIIMPPADGRARAFARNLKTIAGAIIPIGHGTSFEGISEFWTFSPNWWRKTFARHDMSVLEDQAMGIFYTGHMLMSEHLRLPMRKALSSVLGSATWIYVVQSGRRLG